jgi:hypothetical protein
MTRCLFWLVWVSEIISSSASLTASVYKGPLFVQSNLLVGWGGERDIRASET